MRCVPCPTVTGDVPGNMPAVPAAAVLHRHHMTVSVRTMHFDTVVLERESSGLGKLNGVGMRMRMGWRWR